MEQALLLFLPILAGNQAGIIPFLKYPVSSRLLGANKTVGTHLFGPLLGASAVVLEEWYWAVQWPHGLWDGALLGWAAVFGDQLESFFKRRVGILPGVSWWPFDQLDYVVTGMAALWFIIPYDGYTLASIIIFALAIHPIGNGIGYWLGLRKTWL